MVGCYQKVNHAEIFKAEQFCKDKIGIDYILEDFLGTTVIFCLAGSVEMEDNIKTYKVIK